MVARGPGAVGCAHCKVIGADRACQVCARLVCPACAANWATCDEPSGRVVRLGLTARVRDIDPLGRLALVSHWRQPLRVFDLRQLRWAAHVDLPRRLYLWSRAFPPRLLSNGRLVYADMTLPHGDTSGFLGFRGMSLADEHPGWLDRVGGESPQHGTAVSAVSDLFWFVADTQRVVVIRESRETLPANADTVSLAAPGHPPEIRTVTRSYEPLPRKVVQAAHVDGERGLLAAASWSELSLHRIDDASLHRLGHTRTEREGDVRWIALAGGWLAAAVQSGGPTTLELRRLERDHSIGPVVMRHRCTGPFRAASLARDGRYLAVGEGKTLVVLDLERAEVTRFDDHTDAINVVRFAADDHVLISADTDHRVVLRPRTPAGYVRVLVPVAIASS